MKSLLLTLVASTLILSSLTLHATAAILSDDFNDDTIDASIWQASTPFSDSSISESGGNAVFVNRGRILSNASLPTAIEVFGRFSFTGNIHDQFSIATRTNGVTTNQYAEFDLGISFRFQIQNDLGSTTNNVVIARLSHPDVTPIIAQGTYNLALNTPYDFRIVDDGTNVSLYINDLNTPFLTASDSTSPGDRLGILNREGSGGGSSLSDGSVVQLDYIHVVPEPTTLLLVSIAGVLISSRRRRC